jgi:hypothetical protein
MNAQLTALDANTQRIVALTQIVADESHAQPDEVIWRDAFCHECDGSTCLEGTARQLAEKIAAIGWDVENARAFNLICPECSNKDV